jgi:hypothetical protein
MHGGSAQRPNRAEPTIVAQNPGFVADSPDNSQSGAVDGWRVGAIYQIPTSDTAAGGFSASDIARAIASRSATAEGDRPGAGALRGGGEAQATPKAQDLLLQQLAKPIPKNPLQKRQRGGRKGQQMLQSNSALAAPKLRDLPMKGNSVDIGGRDKADLSAWLTDQAHKAEKGLAVGGEEANGGGAFPPMPAADSLGIDGGSASAALQRKDIGNKLRARKPGGGGKVRREDSGIGGGGEDGGGKGGMTMEQASQKDAVLATVGADKPAWQ